MNIFLVPAPLSLSKDYPGGLILMLEPFEVFRIYYFMDRQGIEELKQA